ncbi:MAG: MerC family mercury resistance protein [Chthoniobacterales bacterium]
MRRLALSLERIGSGGALVAAIAAPCCFPIFAALASVAGLGTLGKYESAILYAFQAFALVAFIGLLLGYRSHGRFGPVLLGFLSLGFIGYTFYWSFGSVTLYSGLFALLAASVWNYLTSRTKRQPSAVLSSVITCPHCGHKAEETMPSNACLFFYDCPACGARMKPLAGHCCVFCSYGSVPCPPVQLGSACCA